MNLQFAFVLLVVALLAVGFIAGRTVTLSPEIENAAIRIIKEHTR